MRLSFLLVAFSISCTFPIWASSFTSDAEPSTVESGASNQQLNFTVNNSDSDYNITQVNITIPGGFALISNSNSTTASDTLFYNDSANATWDNTTDTGFVENGTEQHFLLNVSVLSGTGDYNFTVSILDTEGILNSTNVTITVSDTTAPSIDFIPPTDANGTESENKDYITWNVSLSENVSSCSVEINTTNQTGTIVNASSGTYCYFNETGLSGNVTRCAIAHAGDAFGNWNTTPTTICRSTNEQQDIYPPILNFIPPTPANNTYTQNESWVYFNVSAIEEISTCFLDNGTVNLTITLASGSMYCYYNLTGQPNGTEVYRWVWANDTAGNWNRTADLNVTINLTSDATPPYWFSNETGIVTEYSPVQLSYFNITWQDAETGMHTVYIETNLSGSDYNHTMYTEGSGLYQFNYSAPAGDFYWRSWANDTLGNLNVSDTWYFTVAKAPNPIYLYFNGSGDNVSITYEEMSNASAYVTAGSVSLYRNETPVTNPELAVLHAGEHVYKANTSGNQNYTANETALNITVEKRTTGIYLDLTPASPITYGTGTTVTCQANNTEVSPQLYRNDSGVDSENATQVSLAAGYWEYICNCSGTQNYTSAGNTSYYQVSRASMLTHLYLNGSEDNLTADFGNTTNATGEKDNPEGSLDLLLNGTSLGASQHITNLGAGYWNYTLVFAQTENYSANFTTLFVTINQVSSSTSLYLNGSADDQSYGYGEMTNATAYCDYGSLTFHINSTAIVSPFEENLGAGYWNFTAYCSGDSNHTESQNTSHATVNKISSTTTLYLNGSQGNISQTYPESLNTSAYCDYGSLTLQINSTATSSPYEQTLTAGYTYNFTAYCPGDSNHTATEKTFFADVGKASILITLLVNGSAGNLEQTYPDSVNVSAYTNTTSATLHMNSTETTSPFEQTLTAGYTYNLTAFEPDDQNHTGDSETFYVDVSKGDPHLTLLLNGTDGDMVMDEDTTLNITVYLDVSENVEVYLNGSLYDSGNAPFENLSSIENPGALNISSYYSGSQNYTVNSSTHWLTVNDTTPPTLDFTSPTPSNNTYTQNESFVYFNVSSNEQLSTCFLDNGTVNLSMTVTYDYCYYNLTGQPNGTEVYRWVWANDTAGNWNRTADLNVTINLTTDVTPPAFSGHARNPDPPNEDQNVMLNVTVTEDSLDTILLDWNYSTNYTVTTYSGNEYYITILAGNYTAHDQLNYTWYANDTSGNLNASYEQTFTVANQQPGQPSLTFPADYANVSTANVTFQFSSTDQDAEDTPTYYIFINDTLNDSTTSQYIDIDFNDGFYNWSVQADDGYQNSTISATRSFTIDATPPDIEFIPPTDTYGTEPANKDYITWNVSLSENVSSCSVEINTTNQTGTIVNASSSTYCYLNETGLSGNITRCAIAHAEDAFGNWNTTPTTICRSTNEQNDITPPVLDFIPPTPANNTCTQNESWVYFNVSSSEEISTCFLDNGTVNLTMNVNNYYCYYNLTGQTNQTEVYRWVWANDTSDNWNRTADLNVTINLTTDVTPPLITIYSPQNITYNTNTIQLNVSANEPISAWWYQLNYNGTNETFTPNSTIYTDSEGGVNVLAVWANDTSGNENQSIVYFTLDTTSPVLDFTSPTPSNNTCTQNESFVYFNVSASEEISTCFLDNGTVNLSMAVDYDYCQYNLTGQPNGTEVYRWVWANDTAGNWNRTADLNVTINLTSCNAQLRVMIYIPNGTGVLLGAPLEVAGYIEDACGDPVENATVKWTFQKLYNTYTRDHDQDNQSQGWYNYTWTETEKSPGYYNLTMNASKAGYPDNITLKEDAFFISMAPDILSVGSSRTGTCPETFDFWVRLTDDDGNYNNITLWIRKWNETAEDWDGWAFVSQQWRDQLSVDYVHFYPNFTEGSWSSGNYSYMFQSVDEFNFSDTMEGPDNFTINNCSLVFDIRTVSPTPENGSTWGVNFTIKVAFTSPMYPPTECILSLDNGTLTNLTANASQGWCLFNISDQPHGLLNYSVWVGNTYTNDSWNGTWFINVDATPPDILNVTNSTVTSSTAIILWNTSEPSTSVVYYSTNQSNLSSSNSDSSLVTGHSVTLSGLTGNYTYYYNASSCDSSGNCNMSGTYNFTTWSCTESWSCTDWSECSGGTQTRVCTDQNSCGTTLNKPAESQSCEEEGGGGGGSSGVVPPTSVIEESYSWTRITPGNVTVMRLKNSELGVQEIRISVASEANSVYIKVMKLEGNPAGIEQNVTGRVYHYMEIYSRNLDQNLENSTIRFSVNKTWISANGIDRDTITLNRYTDRWSRLPTIRVTENSEVVFYEAECPGFSYFAITGEETGLQEAVCGNGVCEPGESYYACPGDCPAEQPEGGCIPDLMRCRGSYLQQCSSDGESWETLENCLYGCSNETCLEKPDNIFDYIEDIYDYAQVAVSDYPWLPFAVAAVIIIALGAVIIKRRTGRIEAYCLKCKKDVAMRYQGTVSLRSGRKARKGVCPECGTEVFRLYKHPEGEQTKRQAYCMRCRKKVYVMNEKTVTLKNGSKAKKGTCPNCSATTFRLLLKKEPK